MSKEFSNWQWILLGIGIIMILGLIINMIVYYTGNSNLCQYNLSNNIGLIIFGIVLIIILGIMFTKLYNREENMYGISGNTSLNNQYTLLTPQRYREFPSPADGDQSPESNLPIPTSFRESHVNSMFTTDPNIGTPRSISFESSISDED